MAAATGIHKGVVPQSPPHPLRALRHRIFTPRERRVAGCAHVGPLQGRTELTSSPSALKHGASSSDAGAKETRTERLFLLVLLSSPSERAQAFVPAENRLDGTHYGCPAFQDGAVNPTDRAFAQRTPPLCSPREVSGIYTTKDVWPLCRVLSLVLAQFH